jgi:hypothetical protein
VGCVERSAWSGTTTGGLKWPNIFLYFLSFIGPREMLGLFWERKGEPVQWPMAVLVAQVVLFPKKSITFP